MKRIAILALLCVLPALAQIPKPLAYGTINAQATTCAPQSGSAACVFLQVDSQINQVSITINGTYSATLQFEWSPDGGNTWVALTSTPNGGGATVTSTTTTGVWTASVGGGSYVRVRCSAYTSGVAQVTLNPSSATTGAGQTSASGSISPNNGSTGANAFYALAGGSLNIGPDPCSNSNSGIWTIGAVGCTNNGKVQVSGITSGTIALGCNANACTTWSSVTPFQFTAAGGITFRKLNEQAANDFIGSCAMAAATSCTFTLQTAYATPICIVTVQNAAPTTFQAGCTVSGTTVTITASAANSNTWGAIVAGNPN